MKDYWVEVRKRESQAMIEQHKQRRDAHKEAWWQEWARQQQEARIAQTAGNLTIQGEVDVP